MTAKPSMNASLVNKGQGQFALEGELTFDTVGKLLGVTDTVVNGSGDIRIDLAGVSHFDSAGMALLVHWLRETKRSKKTIAFYEAPLQLQMMAKMSGLDRILDIAYSSSPTAE